MDHPQAQVVQIGKRRWVLGMTWLTYGDKPSKQQIKEDADLHRSNWVCMRLGESAIQGGFSAPVEGVKSNGLFSLGAMVADANQQPWIGIYQIAPDLWWYIAVRDEHAILPDGDVIGDWDVVQAARDRHSGYGDWTYVDGDIDDLVELIDSVKKKPTPVYALTGAGLQPKAIAAVALIGLLAIGGAGYWYWNDKNEQEAAMAAKVALARAQLAAKQQQVQAAPSPAFSTPMPNEWLKACGDAVLDLPLSKFGWALDKVACGSNAANVHWVRGEGATVAKHPSCDLTSDGEGCDQSIPLAGLVTSTNDQLLPLPDTITTLTGWAQAAGFQLNVTQIKAAPALPGADTSAVIPPPPQAPFSMDIEVSPFGLDLSSLPGVRLSNLSMTEKGWHLDGVAYGR